MLPSNLEGSNDIDLWWTVLFGIMLDVAYERQYFPFWIECWCCGRSLFSLSCIFGVHLHAFAFGNASRLYWVHGRLLLNIQSFDSK